MVGVAPGPFAIPREADLWFAQHNADSIGHAFDAYVRFRPGTGPASIAGQLRPMWEELAKKYSDQATNRISRCVRCSTRWSAISAGIVVIAFAAAGLLLLLAIVNVANLLLARGATRVREVAVRAALGATRWDVVRSLLAESLLIALAATALGVPLAGAAVRAIVLIGGSALPRSNVRERGRFALQDRCDRGSRRASAEHGRRYWEAVLDLAVELVEAESR